MTIKMTIGESAFEFTSEPADPEGINLAFHWLAAVVGLSDADAAEIAAATQKLRDESAKLKASIDSSSS